MIGIGDVVGRRSYGCDILFKVIAIDTVDKTAILKGLTTRLEATAPISDLVRVNKEDQQRLTHEHANLAKQRMRLLNRGANMQRERALRANASPLESALTKGRIMHLDGDPDYITDCQEFYKSIGSTAQCVFVPEGQQQYYVEKLCREFKADIVVITGHDGKLKFPGQSDDISHYHNSEAFLQAVQALRLVRPDKDDIAIVAGACQSYYEALIGGGANYASSPGRILIDIFDPCIIAVQIASLGVREYLQPESAVKATVGQARGMGGLETKGKARVLYPHS